MYRKPGIVEFPYPLGIFEVASYRNTVCDTGNFYVKRSKKFRDIDCGCCAVYGWVGSHNDFLHISICHPGEKLPNSNVIGANVVQRRDHAVEHMI